MGFNKINKVSSVQPNPLNVTEKHDQDRIGDESMNKTMDLTEQ